MPLEYIDPSMSKEQLQAVRKRPLFSKSFFSLKAKKYIAPRVEQNIPILYPPPEYIYVPLPKPDPIYVYQPVPPSTLPGGYRRGILSGCSTPQVQNLDHIEDDELDELNDEDILAGLRESGRSADEAEAKLFELKNRLNQDETRFENLRERIQAQAKAAQYQTQSLPSQRRPPPSIRAQTLPSLRKGPHVTAASTRSGPPNLRTNFGSFPDYDSPDFKLPPLPSSDGRTVMPELPPSDGRTMYTPSEMPPLPTSDGRTMYARSEMPPLPTSDGRTMYARSDADWANDLRSAPPTEIEDPLPPRRSSSVSAPTKGVQSPVLKPGDDEIWFTDEEDDPRFELSNDYVCDIDLGFGQAFPTLTHLFQSCKFLDEGDAEIIRNRRSAQEAIAMAAKLKPRADWRFVQDAIMRGCLAIKYGDPELRAELLDTLGKKIIYDSEDAYWGRGKSGNGFNKLGIFLMELRNRLWQDEKNGSSDIVATALQIALRFSYKFGSTSRPPSPAPTVKPDPAPSRHTQSRAATDEGPSSSKAESIKAESTTGWGVGSIAKSLTNSIRNAFSEAGSVAGVEEKDNDHSADTKTEKSVSFDLRREYMKCPKRDDDVESQATEKSRRSSTVSLRDAIGQSDNSEKPTDHLKRGYMKAISPKEDNLACDPCSSPFDEPEVPLFSNSSISSNNTCGSVQTYSHNSPPNLSHNPSHKSPLAPQVIIINRGVGEPLSPAEVLSLAGMASGKGVSSGGGNSAVSRTPSLKGNNGVSPRNVPLPASPAMSAISKLSLGSAAGAPGLASQRMGSQHGAPSVKNSVKGKGNKSGTTMDHPSAYNDDVDMQPDDIRTWRRALAQK